MPVKSESRTQEETPVPVFQEIEIPEPQQVERIQFVKPWAGILGSKLIYYPVSCIARVGYSTGEIARKDAAVLINRGTCKPVFDRVE